MLEEKRIVSRLYKLDECPEELPNPRLFPIKGTTVIAVGGCPDTFSDGFIMDLSVTERDRQRLELKVERTASKGAFGTLMGEVERTTILLSEPQYIHAGIDYLSYVLTAPDIKPVGIQVKYYRYFRNRYPNCEFYTNGERLSVKATKVNGKLVGLWMPIILPLMEI